MEGRHGLEHPVRRRSARGLLGDRPQIHRGVQQARSVGPHARRHGRQHHPARARPQIAADWNCLCSLDRYRRGRYRDARHHPVRRAGHRIPPRQHRADRRRDCRTEAGYLTKILTAHLESAATMAEAGIVITQAYTIELATFQRTAERRRAAPTPTMAPVMVWVVETGTPRKVAMNRVAAPPVSAQKPCIGVSLVMRRPMVRTMRQPPISVPIAIAAWHESTTQKGTKNSPPSWPCE